MYGGLYNNLAWFLPQFYIQLVYKATLSFTFRIQIIFLTFMLSNFSVFLIAKKHMPIKSWKNHPHEGPSFRIAKNTQIYFFPYCPELPTQPKQKSLYCKMWLIDQMYIKLGIWVLLLPTLQPWTWRYRMSFFVVKNNNYRKNTLQLKLPF